MMREKCSEICGLDLDVEKIKNAHTIEILRMAKKDKIQFWFSNYDNLNHVELTTSKNIHVEDLCGDFVNALLEHENYKIIDNKTKNELNLQELIDNRTEKPQTVTLDEFF